MFYMNPLIRYFNPAPVSFKKWSSPVDIIERVKKAGAKQSFEDENIFYI